MVSLTLSRLLLQVENMRRRVNSMYPPLAGSGAGPGGAGAGVGVGAGTETNISEFEMCNYGYFHHQLNEPAVSVTVQQERY
jgi:hypothetical protein